MSATAFQRLRREAEAAKLAAENAQNQSDTDMTVKEIKSALDTKGITYDPKAKKPELLKLLEGAE